MTLPFLAIDTMKDSRDRWWGIADVEIDLHIDMVMRFSPRYITVDCFMDWPPLFRRWVTSIRRYNVKIIYRLNWWGWQYYASNSFAGIPVVKVNASQYVTKTAQFIQDNIGYFQDGDIFDACPEFEGGDYWRTYPEPRYNNPTMRQEYNDTILHMFSAFGAIFETAGLNIVANHCSHTPGSFTSGLLFPATVAAHRWITPDGYPDNSHDTPRGAVNVWRAMLETIHDMFPDREIFITEMGYPLRAVSDEQQRTVLWGELQMIKTLPYVVGICYWTAIGYLGHCELITRSGTGWTVRPSAKALLSFYHNNGEAGRVPLS